MNPISQILCVMVLGSGLCDQALAVYLGSAAAVAVELILRLTVSDEQ